MRYLAALFVIYISTPVFAADHYQIIPTWAVMNRSVHIYDALRVDTQSGDILWCTAGMDWGSRPPKLSPAGCQAPISIHGQMPPGPAVLAPHSAVSEPYFGIWKVDQNNGAVSFCAQSEVALGMRDPGVWYCAQIPIVR